MLDLTKHHIKAEWAKLVYALLLCISGIIVSQRASRPVSVILTTVFDVNIVLAAITATFLAVVDHSNSCMLIGLFGLIAVVSYDFVLCNTRQLSKLQVKVVTLTRQGRLLLC